MSSKLRKDLPYRGERWSRENLELFDQYRDMYKKGAKMAEQFYGDRAFIADGEATKYAGGTKLLIMMVEQGAKVAQLLLKCSTKPVVYGDTTGVYYLTREWDAVTAFYIPEHVKWLNVTANDVIIGTYTGHQEELDLDDILLEARTLPHSCSTSELEHLLWISRQGQIGFVHNQEETIEIDGVKYKRVLFVQPMMVPTAWAFTQIRIETNELTDIYLEVSYSDPESRDELLKNPGIGWVDNPDQETPLIKWGGGAVGPLYYKTIAKDDLMGCDLPPPDLPELPDLPDPSLDEKCNLSFV